MMTKQQDAEEGGWGPLLYVLMWGVLLLLGGLESGSRTMLGLATACLAAPALYWLYSRVSPAASMSAAAYGQRAKLLGPRYVDGYRVVERSAEGIGFATLVGAVV